MKRVWVILAYFSAIIFGLLIGCQRTYSFVPVNNAYFNNLSLDGVQIKFMSFYARESPPYIILEFLIVNDDDKKIDLENEIQINGNYFQSNYINQIAVYDLLNEKSEGVIYPNSASGLFQLPYKKFTLSISCFLNNKGRESFRKVIKKEIFAVQLPKMVIEGKTYDFEEIDFIYNTAKNENSNIGG